MAVAARRCDVAVRTIRNWIDAGMVRGAMPTGSGRVRLVDVVSVVNYIAAHLTTPRTCEQCGKDIAPPGVRRAARVQQRRCSPRCKRASPRRPPPGRMTVVVVVVVVAV